MIGVFGTICETMVRLEYGLAVTPGSEANEYRPFQGKIACSRSPLSLAISSSLVLDIYVSPLREHARPFFPPNFSTQILVISAILSEHSMHIL